MLTNVSPRIIGVCGCSISGAYLIACVWRTAATILATEDICDSRVKIHFSLFSFALLEFSSMFGVVVYDR
jgi:hypothetical protein